MGFGEEDCRRFVGADKLLNKGEKRLLIVNNTVIGDELGITDLRVSWKVHR